MHFLPLRREPAALIVMAFLAIFWMPLRVIAQPPKGAAQTKTAPPPGAPDLSTLPPTQKIPETFDALFAARDARAVDAISYFRCMQATVNALRSGQLGNVSRDWSITCIDQKGEWRGVFGQLTDTGIDVKLQVAERGGKTVRLAERVDTVRAGGTARALLRGLAAPLPGNGTYEFMPVPLPQDKFIEVWFLPVPSDPTRAIIGGDSLIQMASSGARELGHTKSTPPIRSVAVPLTGKEFALASGEERIPAVSELILAHMALDLVKEVRVTTRTYTSVLTRHETTRVARWTHHPR